MDQILFFILNNIFGNRSSFLFRFLIINLVLKFQLFKKFDFIVLRKNRGIFRAFQSFLKTAQTLSQVSRSLFFVILEKMWVILWIIGYFSFFFLLKHF